jgi:hypothetical protein
MGDIAWETVHSVDSQASLPFAWAYMTNVANWEDPPATFELDGPFAVGSRGTTRMPGQELLHWQLAQVNQLESYVLEMELDRAVITFEWRFGRLPGGTRFSQRIVIKGANAATYVSQVAAAFGSNLAAGMSRLVSAIEQAEARGGSVASTPP